MEIDLPKLRLITYRDHLFDKYLEMYDKYQKWNTGSGKLVHTRITKRKETQSELAFMIKNHLMEISEELRSLDERICKHDTPDEVFVKNNEIY